MDDIEQVFSIKVETRDEGDTRYRYCVRVGDNDSDNDALDLTDSKQQLLQFIVSELAKRIQ